jgi:hypothetical protein
LVLVLVVLTPARAQQATEAEPQASPAVAQDAPVGDPAASAGRRVASARRSAGIDDRVELVGRELDLSPAQRAQLKTILLDQRTEIARLWSDPSVPGATRIAATQAVSDRTADHIRAMLTDEQRKKYIHAHQRDAAVGTAGGNVERWMNAPASGTPAPDVQPAVKGR